MGQKDTWHSFWVKTQYLLTVCSSENVELLKQEGANPYEYMNSLEKFEEKELPNKQCFFSSTTKKKLLMMVKYQMVT